VGGRKSESGVASSEKFDSSNWLNSKQTLSAKEEVKSFSLGRLLYFFKAEKRYCLFMPPVSLLSTLPGT